MNRLIPLFIIPCTFLLYLLNIRESIFFKYAFMNPQPETQACGEQDASTAETLQDVHAHATTEDVQDIDTRPKPNNESLQNNHSETTSEDLQDTCEEPLTEADACDLCVSNPVALIEQVNSYRAASGLLSLSHSSELDTAAAIRCRELVTNMSHTRPDARSCSTVYTDLGISASVWGENLAAGYYSAAEVAADWMASATHMANILDPSFTRCGVAYLSCDTGYGSYWVILFAD